MAFWDAVQPRHVRQAAAEYILPKSSNFRIYKEIPFYARQYEKIRQF